jgi:hypothetical protein
VQQLLKTGLVNNFHIISESILPVSIVFFHSFITPFIYFRQKAHLSGYIFEPINYENFLNNLIQENENKNLCSAFAAFWHLAPVPKNILKAMEQL